MKSTLVPGDSITRKLDVNEERCIAFMGPENAVYATPRMVSDMEYTCRDLLLRHLDPGEDSVGAHVSIDHLAAKFAMTPVSAFTVTREPRSCGHLCGIDGRIYIPATRRPLRGKIAQATEGPMTLGESQ